MLEPEVSGVDGSSEQGKVEQDFIWVFLQGFVLVGCFLQGVVFVAWFLLVGEASKWKVWSSDGCWRRPAQELVVLMTSEAGCLGQGNS